MWGRKGSTAPPSQLGALCVKNAVCQRNLPSLQEVEEDQMVTRAGDFLIATLARAERLLWLRRRRKAALAVAAGAAIVMAYRAFRRLRSGRRK